LRTFWKIVKREQRAKRQSRYLLLGTIGIGFAFNKGLNDLLRNKFDTINCIHMDL